MKAIWMTIWPFEWSVHFSCYTDHWCICFSFYPWNISLLKLYKTIDKIINSYNYHPSFFFNLNQPFNKSWRTYKCQWNHMLHACTYSKSKFCEGLDQHYIHYLHGYVKFLGGHTKNYLSNLNFVFFMRCKFHISLIYFSSIRFSKILYSNFVVN